MNARYVFAKILPTLLSVLLIVMATAGGVNCLTNVVTSTSMPRPTVVDKSNTRLRRMLPLQSSTRSIATYSKLSVNKMKDLESMSIMNQTFREIKIDDLRNFTSLSSLELLANQLEKLIPTSMNFTLPALQYLSLAKNNIDAVPNAALSSFPNLDTLILSYNKISVIFRDDFRYNKRLQFLTLGPNPIVVFNDEWMTKLALVNMNLRGCGLTSLPSAVSNLSRLEAADFSSNSISKLTANSFSSCSNLYALDMASNGLTSIDENAFKGAGKLNFVDLSDNLLQTLAPNTFEDIRADNLHIYLHDNILNCNCSMAGFKDWLDVRQLEDESTVIPYKCVQPLRNHGKKGDKLSTEDFTCRSNDVLWKECRTSKTLTVPVVKTTNTTTNRSCPSLCICYDQNGTLYSPSTAPNFQKKSSYFSSWTRYRFPQTTCVDTNYTSFPTGFPNDVVYLTMSRNQMESINIKNLENLQNLKSLQLKHNSIRNLQSDDGTVLLNLKYLDLSYNQITLITKKHLQSFPNITTLSLNNNAIKVAPGDLLMYNRKIHGLFLGSNPVENFPENIAENLNLTGLSLRNLSLNMVPKSIQNMKTLMYADLSDNIITNLTNSTFSECTRLVLIDLDNNRISTIEADTFNGAEKLMMIRLSENQISALPATVFSNVSKTRLKVDVWQNPFACDCKMKGFKSWLEKVDSPGVEIRFHCVNPSRMHGKRSEDLNADDFMCKDNDVSYRIIVASCKNPAGLVVLTVVVTSACIVMMYMLVMRLKAKRRSGRFLYYSRQRNDED